MAALMLQQRTGALSSEQANEVVAAFKQEFAGLYHEFAMTEDVVEEAMQLAEQHPLRGYDAVQLAAAQVLQQRRSMRELDLMHFVSADVTLNEAATAEGFVVDNPNHEAS